MNCPRGMYPRHFNVILRDHAWERYKERDGPQIKRSKLVGILIGKLNEAIDLGLRLDHTGAGWIEVTPWLWATVRLGQTAWVVETITRWDEKKGEAG